MTEPSIEVHNLSLAYRVARGRAASMKEYTINLLKRQMVYEQFWALDDVSFQVEKGEVFAVIGPNGAGKSTLLKVLAGVLPPNQGRVIVRGFVSPLIELSGGINQEMTGRENIVMFGTLLGRDPDEMYERIDEIAEWAELTEFLDAPAHTYSTGMVSRLAFAIGTDVHPEVLLVDEILSVGDEKFSRKSQARMRQLMEGGTTVVLVSHSLTQVQNLASRAMWLDRGRIKMIGQVDEVVAAYRDSV